jgi:hypothetical protein
MTELRVEIPGDKIGLGGTTVAGTIVEGGVVVEGV